jgi:hypothetical protein
MYFNCGENVDGENSSCIVVGVRGSLMGIRIANKRNRVIGRKAATMDEVSGKERCEIVMLTWEPKV